MIKYRMEFKKGEAVRFVSHLELMKVFIQAINRAGIPVCWTEGFNPRPKINFSSAIATGMTSLGECMEMELAEEIDEEKLQAMLNRELPDGFRVKRTRRLEEKQKSLMALLRYADYRVEVPVSPGMEEEETRREVGTFLQEESIPWTVHTPKGKKEKDLRPGIVFLEVLETGDKLVLQLRLQSGSSGNVRPEHAVQAFIRHAGQTPAGVMKIEKQAVYGLKNGEPVYLFDL